MGFALLIVGLLMVITGARGTYTQFGSQIASEFTGQNNFTYWLIAIGAVGAVGYIQSLQVISRYLMALIILSIFLSHKGFFSQFQAALQSGPKQPNTTGSNSSNTTNALDSALNSAGIPLTPGAFGNQLANPNAAINNPSTWFQQFFGTTPAY